MDDFIRILIICTCVIIFFCCVGGFVYSVAKKNSIKKMYLDIEKTLESLIEADNDDFNFIKHYSNAYDYIFDTPSFKYYIKVIPNFGNQEICVNNSVKWQLRKSFNDETMRFVENVEGLMRMDIDDEKNAKKLYIVYPNARSLLKYINECEMIFIHPDTDVYGTNIIPYLALKDDPKLIKVTNEI